MMATSVTTEFMLFNSLYQGTRREDGYISVALWDGRLWKPTRNPRAIESARLALETAYPVEVEVSWRRPL